MRGDHADLVRLQAERVHALQVHPRVRLVGAGDLGAEDRVPRQLRVLGEVDGLGDVAVRAGRDDVGLLELGEAFDDVGPGIEAVPALDELARSGSGSVEPVVARARCRARSGAARRGSPTAACRCARSPAAAGTRRATPSASSGGSPKRSTSRMHRRAPVDARPEHVEEQRPHPASILTGHGGTARRAEPGAEGAPAHRRRLLVAARRAGRSACARS